MAGSQSVSSLVNYLINWRKVSLQSILCQNQNWCQDCSLTDWLTVYHLWLITGRCRLKCVEDIVSGINRSYFIKSCYNTQIGGCGSGWGVLGVKMKKVCRSEALKIVVWVALAVGGWSEVVEQSLGTVPPPPCRLEIFLTLRCQYSADRRASHYPRSLP